MTRLALHKSLDRSLCIIFFAILFSSPNVPVIFAGTVLGLICLLADVWKSKRHCLPCPYKLPLVLLLLLPTVGGAGDFDFIFPEKHDAGPMEMRCWYKTTVPGQDTSVTCEPIQPSSCYEQMREAMRQAERGRVEHGSKQLNDWIVIQMFKEDREHWDRTIKECVH